MREVTAAPGDHPVSRSDLAKGPEVAKAAADPSPRARPLRRTWGRVEGGGPGGAGGVVWRTGPPGARARGHGPGWAGARGRDGATEGGERRELTAARVDGRGSGSDWGKGPGVGKAAADPGPGARPLGRTWGMVGVGAAMAG